MKHPILIDLEQNYPLLKAVIPQVYEAFVLMRDSFSQGGKLLVAGNGGSCADSEHIVGELMKGFVKKRSVPAEFADALAAADPKRGAELAEKLQGALPAISLTGHPALSTAYLNDVDAALIYAQQLYGYGREGDVFLAISTSGNAKNLSYALAVAKAKNIKTIGLTGKDGGELKRCCDCAIVIPSQETYRIQEYHLPVYHALCLMLEDYFF